MTEPTISEMHCGEHRENDTGGLFRSQSVSRSKGSGRSGREVRMAKVVAELAGELLE